MEHHSPGVTVVLTEKTLSFPVSLVRDGVQKKSHILGTVSLPLSPPPLCRWGFLVLIEGEIICYFHPTSSTLGGG